LKAVGICTIRAIQMTARRNLIKIKGLSETKVDKICEAANKILDCGFITATECAFKRQSIFRLETGCKEFDAILGGGFQSMAITEVFGEFRTGKTQIAHTLCVKAQMPVSMGGCAGKAAYIDTEGTFRPERLRAIAERYDMVNISTFYNLGTRGSL
jgi:meiotic recombination protein DMC1